MKTKIFLLIFFIGFIQIIINAQTNVSGIISTNTTWTLANSPYIINGNVLVQPGVTLTIEAGAEIKFGGNYLIQVNGKLLARGLLGSEIKFTSNLAAPKPGSWGSIYFASGCSTESIISNCKFYYGGSEKGIIICKEFLTIEETTFSNSSSAAIFVENSCVNISNSKIFNNKKGIEFKNNIRGNVNIINNQFLNNNIDGIYLDAWSEQILIEGNDISNSLTGITYTNDGGSGGAACTINSNKIKNCGTAVYTYGNGVTITSNVFTNNITTINIQGGYNPFTFYIKNNVITNTTKAILLKHLAYIGIVEIFNNVICNNNTSSELIYLEGNYTHNGGVVPPDYNNYKFMNNTIYNNSCQTLIKTSKFAKINYNTFGNNDADYIIYHDDIQDRTLNATNNYWNGLENYQIGTKIYDWNDNTTKGIVSFEPKLEIPNISNPVSSPINVYKSSSENGIVVTWDSQLETDLAGYKIYFNPTDGFTYSNSIEIGNVNSYFLPNIELSDTIVITAYDNEADGTNDLLEGHESWYSQPAQLHFTYNLLSNNSYCDGDKIVYQLNTIADFKDNNIFIVQLSDTTGSFEHSINLVSVDTSNSVLITASFPDTLIYNKTYKIRVKSTNPEVSTNSENVIFYQTPTSEFVLDTNKLCGSNSALISYIGTGSPNATYNWNFNSGDIISGAEQGNYKINWKNSGLKKISLSVEENGCTSILTTQNVKVYQPNSTFTLDSVVCEKLNTKIAYIGSASDSAVLNWNFDGANIVSENNESYIVNWDNVGNKNISLIINDNGCLSSQTIQTIQHNPIPTPKFNTPEKVCYDGIANIMYDGTATDFAMYKWNFDAGLILSGIGKGPYEIMWSNSGLKTVSLNVTENGCSSDTSINLTVNEQTQPISICMVSVDSSNHNMIIWEHTSDNPYDSIKIFKETSQSDVYERIGAQSSSNATLYIDENSNPAQNSSRYKIAVIDTCGYETSQSAYHKTIHLTISSGINGAFNLIWDGYEGFNYSTYNIYRGTSDNNLLKIAEQASNTFTFTDLIPPVETVYYQMEVINPNSCNNSNLKSSTDNYVSTYSNIVNSNQINSINRYSFESIEIYPNPADEVIYIESINTTNYDMEIFSFDGKLQLKIQNIGNKSEIDVSNLRPGLYLIRLNGNKKSMNMKLIKK